MIAAFERFVRPYQIVEIPTRDGRFIQRRVFSDLAEVEAPIESKLIWSASTSINDVTIPPHELGSADEKDEEDELVEIAREVVTRRVENPEDPSNFVDVDDAIRLELARRPKKHWLDLPYIGIEISIARINEIQKQTYTFKPQG